MRILHVATRHRRGGAEKHLINWVRHQQELGHEVDVAVGTEDLADTFPPGTSVLPIPTFTREVSPIADGWTLATLRRAITARRYQLVHTHQSKAGILGRVAARGIAPAVVHTVHMSSFGSAYGRQASRIYRAAERHCAGFTTAIVSVSRVLIDRYVAAGVGPLDLFVLIRSPIDVDGYAALRRCTEVERDAVRARLGLPTDIPLALSVGALDRRKRHDLTIGALAPLLGRRGLHLAIAGDGPEYARLARQIERASLGASVHLVGFADDIKPLLAAADVLVHVAKGEGVPQAVIEAMLAGTPVVAARSEWVDEFDRIPGAVVGQDGAGLEDAIMRTIREPVCPLDVDDFDEWRPEVVRGQIDALDRFIGEHVRTVKR